MLQTGESLSDISFRCGFVDQAHLCKHFRRVTGETPAAWRRARSPGDSRQPALKRACKWKRGVVTHAGASNTKIRSASRDPTHRAVLAKCCDRGGANITAASGVETKR
jgi:hypothetical protein